MKSGNLKFMREESRSSMWPFLMQFSIILPKAQAKNTQLTEKRVSLGLAVLILGTHQISRLRNMQICTAVSVITFL